MNTTGRAFHAAGFPLLIAIPLLQQADRGAFARAATTAYAGHRRLATKVQGLTDGAPVWIRLGWEANKGYHWSYARHGGSPDPANPADYKTCWRNAAAAWREHCPNAHLVWNHLKFPISSANRITDYYPGDDAVDVVSIDPYDNGSFGHADTAQGFADAILGTRGGFPGFEPSTGRCQGLQGIRLFAESRGKRWAVDEWGPTNASRTATNRANNSYYCRAMFNYFAEHAPEYDCFFNGSSGSTHQIYPRVAYNGRASDAYRTAW